MATIVLGIQYACLIYAAGCLTTLLTDGRWEPTVVALVISVGVGLLHFGMLLQRRFGQ